MHRACYSRFLPGYCAQGLMLIHFMSAERMVGAYIPRRTTTIGPKDIVLRSTINDELIFKYKKGHDSVLVVNQNDYTKCNKDNPIKALKSGHSKFKFDRSGPFFFISGHEQNCEKGQKLTIIVLSHHHHHHHHRHNHHHHNITPSHSPETSLKPPSPAPTTSHKAPTPTPIVHHSPPAEKAPAHAPSIKPPTYSPSPKASSYFPSLSPIAKTPTHAPSRDPPSHSPSPSPAANTFAHVTPNMPPSHSPSPSPKSKIPTHTPRFEPHSHSPSHFPTAKTPTHRPLVPPLSHAPSPCPISHHLSLPQSESPKNNYGAPRPDPQHQRHSLSLQTTPSGPSTTPCSGPCTIGFFKLECFLCSSSGIWSCCDDDFCRHCLSFLSS
ncbi:hypothetical protein OROMI_019646 [Orobanche minor]